MINLEALHNITYGLYIVSSGNNTEGNGYIANTVFQITSDPVKFAISCNKNNYTEKLIEKYQNFAISVLHQKTKPETFGNFGFKSGKNINKLDGLNIKYGKTGAPVILNDSIAYFEFKLSEKIDQGSHWLFIGELANAQIIDKTFDPMTYAFYKTDRKGVAPKNAPTYIKKDKMQTTTKLKVYQCAVCGHIYDNSIEKIKFEDLPD